MFEIMQCTWVAAMIVVTVSLTILFCYYYFLLLLFCILLLFFWHMYLHTYPHVQWKFHICNIANTGEGQLYCVLWLSTYKYNSLNIQIFFFQLIYLVPGIGFRNYNQIIRYFSRLIFRNYVELLHGYWNSQ